MRRSWATLKAIPDRTPPSPTFPLCRFRTIRHLPPSPGGEAPHRRSSSTGHFDQGVTSKRIDPPKSNGPTKPADNLSLRERTSELDALATPDLMDLLRRRALVSGFEAVHELVDYLFTHRRVVPNVRIFRALILANSDAPNGAVSRVQKHLQEMRSRGISIDSGVCHDVLRVLAVHPDAFLRAEILGFMRNQDYEISTGGKHDVAAGFIKECKIEQGLAMLARLREAGEPVQSWLSDMAITWLLDVGDVSGAQAEVTARLVEDDLSLPMWYIYLDTASEAQHHGATAQAWSGQVRPGFLRPSTGTLRNVLSTAARHGDARLASEAFQQLAKTAVNLGEQDYHKLCEAYLAAGNLEAALSAVALAVENGTFIGPASTRVFYSFFLRDAVLEEAETILRRLRDRGRKVSLPVVNAMLEAYVQGKNAEAVLNLYKTMHTFGEDRGEGGTGGQFADTTTFEIMYGAIRLMENGAYEMSCFLRQEQAIMGIPLTSLMMDRAILAIAKFQIVEGIHELPSLLEELKRSGKQLRSGTAHQLLVLMERGQIASLQPWESWIRQGVRIAGT